MRNAVIAAEPMGIIVVSWKRIIAWDGILPAAVVGIPTIASFLFGPNNLFTLLTALALPIIASFIRASAAPEHLRLVGPPWLIRKLLFAAAIAFLFFLELMTTFTQLANPAVEEELILLAGYVIYFGMIVLTFRRFPLSLLRISFDDDSTIVE